MIRIYEALKARHLTGSLRHFSTNWCGRASNYASDRGDDTMSPETALELLRRLMTAGQRDLAQQVLTSLIRGSAVGSGAHHHDLLDQS